jgi:hypothetical protein
LISPSLLEEIRRDSFLKYMHKQVVQFDKYLDSTNDCKIGFKGLSLNPDDPTHAPHPVQYELEYKHRWTKSYDNMILFQLYNLQWYYLLNPDKAPNYTMMVTLTGTHASPKTPRLGGLSHMAYLGKFHEAHRKAKDLLRKYLNTDKSLSILEGHPKSGYVHAHNLYFLDECPTKKTLGILSHHWNNTLGMGSKKHGMKVELKEPRDFKDIKSFIAYPMAYLGKTSIGDLPEWSKYDVIFNTCLWLAPRSKQFGGIGHRVRAFQPSRALSRIMRPKVQQNEYIHIETVISNKKLVEPTVLYQAPSYDVNFATWMNLGGDEPDNLVCELHDF